MTEHPSINWPPVPFRGVVWCDVRNHWLKDLFTAAFVGGFSVGLVAGLVFFGMRAVL